MSNKQKVIIVKTMILNGGNDQGVVRSLEASPHPPGGSGCHHPDLLMSD